MLMAQPDGSMEGILFGQQIYFISLDKITQFKGQPRKFFDPKALELLSLSLESEGQFQPIRVCKDDNNAGKFILIGGERRWRAFHLMQERTGKAPLVKAVIDSVKSAEEHFYKAVIDNLLREDLGPIDEAATLAQLFNDGHSVKKLATMIGKSISYVDGYLKLNTLSDEIKEFMSLSRPKSRRLSVTAAIQIARSTPHEGLRLEITKEAIARELGLRETRFLIENKTKTRGNTLANVSNDSSLLGTTGMHLDPVTAYKSFKATLGRNIESFKKMDRDNVDRLYHYRTDEYADRAFDVERINDLIEVLKRIREKIRE